jgi:hypothetical protein
MDPVEFLVRTQGTTQVVAVTLNTGETIKGIVRGVTFDIFLPVAQEIRHVRGADITHAEPVSA